MKIKIVKKDYPSESPGVWKDSTLSIYLKGPKDIIEKLMEAVGKIMGAEKERGRG